MDERLAKVERFLARHASARADGPLLLPNPWDAGIARLLASLGFEALATTSSGFAGTLGRLDYEVTREEAIAHAAELGAATPVPVSGDLENGFGAAPEECAETVRQAAAAGLAGCSIEDFTGRRDDPIYERSHAVERIAAAAEEARRPEGRIVLTARAENALHRRNDFEDTLARLHAFAEAGADVVYAPGLVEASEIRRVVEAVPAPVNVLLRPGGPGLAELADAGVARVSVGGALHLGSLAAVAEQASALLQGDGEPMLRAAAAGFPLRKVFRRDP